MVKNVKKNRQCKLFLCQLFIFGYYNIKEKTWKKPGQKCHDYHRDKKLKINYFGYLNYKYHTHQKYLFDVLNLIFKKSSCF